MQYEGSKLSQLVITKYFIPISHKMAGINGLKMTSEKLFVEWSLCMYFCVSHYLLLNSKTFSIVYSCSCVYVLCMYYLSSINIINNCDIRCPCVFDMCHIIYTTTNKAEIWHFLLFVKTKQPLVSLNVVNPVCDVKDDNTEWITRQLLLYSVYWMSNQ